MQVNKRSLLLVHLQKGVDRSREKSGLSQETESIQLGAYAVDVLCPVFLFHLVSVTSLRKNLASFHGKHGFTLKYENFLCLQSFQFYKSFEEKIIFSLFVFLDFLK